ncbi:MAG TPA: PEP-CTERM sorting domain-containing protein [Verrucomicrobiae bacterium]|nr:PEP-CTERM sorting domain-containing protein [Verrucomicrobiae bacterium]
MSTMKFAIIACALAACAAGAIASAQSIYTYPITIDTYIDSGNPTSNFGAYGYAKVVDSNKPSTSPSECHTLFDLPANLFACAPGDIVSASVSFYVWSDSTGNYNVSLAPLTRAFGAGTGASSKGTSPANGATWLTSDGTNSWATPGGDYDSANAIVGVKGPLGPNPADPSGRFITWDITSLLANPTTAAELQDDGAMLTIDLGEPLPPANQQYYASFTSADSTSYQAPYLPSVELTVVPEPSSLALLVIGLTGLPLFLMKAKSRS